MSERLLAVLGMVAALGLSTPALMADHGDEGHKNKHFDGNYDQGWQRGDGYEYRTYGDRDERPPGWNRGKKTGWAIVDCDRTKRRSMDVGHTSMRAVRTNTTRTRLGESSFVARSLRFMAA